MQRQSACMQQNCSQRPLFRRTRGVSPLSYYAADVDKCARLTTFTPQKPCWSFAYNTSSVLSVSRRQISGFYATADQNVVALKCQAVIFFMTSRSMSRDRAKRAFEKRNCGNYWSGIVWFCAAIAKFSELINARRSWTYSTERCEAPFRTLRRQYYWVLVEVYIIREVTLLTRSIKYIINVKYHGTLWTHNVEHFKRTAQNNVNARSGTL